MEVNKRLLLPYIIISLILLFVQLNYYNFFYNYELSILIKSILSSLGCISILYVLINNYLWKFWIVQKLLGINIPTIHGHWRGYIQSSFSKFEVKYPVDVYFDQSLTHISLHFENEDSTGNSIIANFAEKSFGGYLKFFCIYRNQPRKTDRTDLLPHDGVFELNIHPNFKIIDGIYFNDAHKRNTYGQIYLEFISLTNPFKG